ncbi:hypothetical protein A2996_02780 [Candidatus Campbellbacteria bacterium RIFCSPLOWO2_01_FULL_34_15]|uniref:Uncharacterized protein n=1 Tax=Candidatus Campbellbacteria bacterium RIFCSPLOWO2_01_FULL_34_15 TaxID=1797579 RepID=A0A1F5ENY0_9BACT|nr:MAG: hypothetical protein A2996_02780 [Candidatus Campbellbacteria bacterium RIFCSPLOWO2_01_FULL_34_15]
MKPKREFGLVPVLVQIERTDSFIRNYKGMIVLGEKIIFHFDVLTTQDIRDCSVKLKNNFNIDNRLLCMSIEIKNSSGEKIFLDKIKYDFFYNILVDHIGRLEYDIESGNLNRRRPLTRLTTDGWFSIYPSRETDCYSLSISSRKIPQGIKECETLLLT